MVCGGFKCSRNTLCLINTVFMMVGLLFVGIAAYGKGFGIISSLSLVGGIISVGILLFIIGLIGVIGALRHHQVLLFFYMAVMVPMFVIELAVSCACLALPESQELNLLKASWQHANRTREDVQNNLHCCGFTNTTESPECAQKHPNFPRCLDVLSGSLDVVLRAAGITGLLFSFLELLSLWLTQRYRNMKDPLTRSGAFL
uniref:tetraspanin-31-like n=1 Tax=Myxine glutinosa TaxID=7769 RepID=UPI00358EEC62